MKPWSSLFCFLCGLSLLGTAVLPGNAQEAPLSPDLRIPAFTAYSEPNPDSVQVSEAQGITGWTEAKTRICWYGYLAGPGELEASVVLRLPETTSVTLRLTLAKQAHTAHAAGSAADVTMDFGRFTIPAAGYYRFALEGVDKQGKTFGDLETLVLRGPAIQDAHFNRKERRNAASVHLGYPVPPGTPVFAFYNEVTVRTEPIWSYYMACGFARGYFGIQVNSPTERRIIFSVWDSGSEAVDRSKVAPEDRVQLLAKGEGVFAGDFGNEGTGGHSHRVYPWKKGVTYRFLVTARPDGAHTVYAGYFFFPEQKRWGLIARFRAPRDGGSLRGLYSFNENFGGANGQLRRCAEFGNQWIQGADGNWTELTTARFTHDPTGRLDRKDYAAGVVGKRFYLSNGLLDRLTPGSMESELRADAPGGQAPSQTIAYGTLFHRPASGVRPEAIKLPIP